MSANTTVQTSITFFIAGVTDSPVKNDGDFLIIGQQSELLNALNGETTAKWLSNLGAANLHGLAQSLKPGKVVSASSAVSTAQVNGDNVNKVTLVALPTLCSRHNSPSQPHAIADAVRKHLNRSSKATNVVLVLSDSSHAFSAAVSVPRAIKHYSAKTKVSEPHKVHVHLLDSKRFDASVKTDTDADSKLLSSLASVGSGVGLAARLVDTPPNLLHTDAFVSEADEVFQAIQVLFPEAPVAMKVIKGEQLRDQGFGLLWGVGKASTHLPALVVLSHNGDSEKPGVAMCGKGIVYDTGGLSIKSKTGMPGMKADMGGAAAILGTWQAVVSQGGLPDGRPLHAVLCLAENSVGPEATRPDDIHMAFSGKTVEIVNTDAEGRLVLGDGVAYAAQVLKASTIVDVATLTGAQGVATGQRHASIYTSSENAEELAVKAGKFSGDLCHPMPYCPEMFKMEFRSPVADMTNNVRNRSNAQVSCAGQFIGNHLPDGWLDSEDNVWLHIDMAAPATDNASEQATGFGVALLSILLGVADKSLSL